MIQYAIERKTLIRVHVKINPKASVLNMNCCRALIVNLQKVFYNSQASVGDRQYTIILFISIIFFPTIRNYLNDREGAPLSFGRILAPHNAPPTIPKYFTILMTEMRDAIIFVGCWRPPNAPPSPDATILNYLNDREVAGIIFCRILAPPPMTPQYLTILMTERRGAIIFCRTLAPLNAPPDATILNYLYDREGGGAIFFCRILAPPPPFPRRHNTY